MTPIGKSIMTFVKFMTWFALAAAIDAAIEYLTVLNLGPLFTPTLGALLKALATWWATKKTQK